MNGPSIREWGLPVSASDETGSLTQAFNRMVVGLEERERLRDAFGTFVDPELAERVTRDGTDLRGEEVDVSVLFMDVRGVAAALEIAQTVNSGAGGDLRIGLGINSGNVVVGTIGGAAGSTSP